MTGIKRYITAWALLLLMSAPLLAMVYYLAQQQYLRHEMKERLETEALQTLVLQPDELNWAKAGKELWVKNHLFDVKSITRTANGYLVKGLFDHEETAITQKAAQQTGGQIDDSVQAALQLLLLTIFQPTHNTIAITAPAVQLPNGYASYQAATCTITVGVATPPPNRA